MTSHPMPQPRRNAPIQTWQAGELVEGFALVTRKEARQDRYGQEYLDLELADASGSIVAKAWPDSPIVTGDFEVHDFVMLSGTVRSYRGQRQMSLDACRRATAEDRARGFDEALLIPTTPEDLDRLWERLTAIYPGEIRHPAMQRLAADAIVVHGASLRLHPAAKVMHHAYRGGLLEHVVSMADLALLVAAHYRQIDRDQLLLGVLFHDLGKLRELGAMPANEYTTEGHLVGHVVIGRDLLRELVAGIPGFPADQRLALEHLVLAHQGRLEFGSPVEPTTPEALVLHFLDDLDAKLNQVEKARRGGVGFQYVAGLGRRMWLGTGEQDREV